MRRCVVAFVAFTLALGACGKSSKSESAATTVATLTTTTAVVSPTTAVKHTDADAGEHLTAADIARRLRPLGCEPTVEEPSDFSVAKLTCVVSDENTTIEEYRNANDLESAKTEAKGVGCAFAKAAGFDSFVVVFGDWWAVTPDTAGVAQSIQRTLGQGRVTTFNC